MQFRGVLFDLFGTLVPAFRKREHAAAIEACAEQLGISSQDCYRYWGETFPQRMRGAFTSVAENFDWIARRAERRASPAALKRAEAIYQQFTIEGLQPVAGALPLLEWLASQGLRIGLVSNCAPDVPQVWPATVFAQYFDACIFSCLAGCVKPEQRIYQLALEALELDPRATLYVGDGSDQELSGAARCDMQPVLIATDLSNTYDDVRADIDSWNGPIIHSLSALPALVSGAVPA